MTSVVPAGKLYKFVSHKRKVLSLYKRALRHLEAFCFEEGRHVFAYERTLLRARFDLHKDEPDFKRATQLLRLGEEEFWVNQHPDPVLLPNEEGGVTFQRHATYQVPERALDHWEPHEKAMFPDYFAKREKWQGIRRKTWSEEMQWLQEWDKKNIDNGISLTDALPAAKEKDGYPPFWWRTVTRPLEQPKLMEWWPNNEDSFSR
ncbi:NADH dehydrogenase [ubiquinone] 1 beta subcomplex subunit 9-like [Clavelina lepadiformis]|uniref:NADH dehydrogenase [ubiquinone] 1 beta subcomplex subunit 9 n=1 Tax=Clavelina lepadiformis TaxID=159417 RepID=A0ABP0G3B6_CLALP